MDVSAAGLFLLFFAIAETIKVVPKTEFEDNSPGINPDHTVTYLNKEVTSISPGVVKAVLEVNLGGGIITDKRPNKTDKKNASKKNKILICNDEGKCKYHEIKESDDDTDDDDDDDDSEEDGDGKKLKPIIVTDFDKDPLGSKKDKDDDDYDKKHGKKIPKVPVRVGYKGAVTDYSFHYPGNRADGFNYPGNSFGVDRLPAYYGMKLSPEFHQPYPGPVLYDDTSNIPPYTGFNHGSYYPSFSYDHDTSYGYSPYSGHYSIYDYPDHIGSNPFDQSSFPGHGPSRTPTPYGQFYPTRRPGTFPGIITSTGWSSSGPDRPGEYWPSSTGSSRPGLVSPGVYLPSGTGSGRPGSHSPGVYLPSGTGRPGGANPDVYLPSGTGSRRPGGGSPGVYLPSGTASGRPGGANPGVYLPSDTGSGRPGGANPGVYLPSGTGSRRPGVYWPKEKPLEDPKTPPDISVRGKMDFDEDELISGGTGPTGSADSTGSGGFKVDGKLGDPFKRSNT